MIDRKRLRKLVKESDAYLYPSMNLKDYDTKMDVLGIMAEMVVAGATKVRPLYNDAVKKQRVGKRLLEKAVKLSEEKLKKVM